MNLEIISKVIEIYGSVLRREREPYVAHVIRVANGVKKVGFSDRAILLSLLHDAVELDVSLDSLIISFNLNEKEVKTLKVLTREYGEKSHEHFDRIIKSKDVVAQVIKYFDNLDNSIFTLEDHSFTRDKLLLDPEYEIEKYKTRANILKDLLITEGFSI